MTQARIRKQIQQLQEQEAKDEGFIFQQSILQNNVQVVIVGIRGPSNTPYEGGIFYLKINMQSFPFKAPQCKLLTPIYNPAFESDGSIHCCYDFSHGLKQKWAPTHKLIKLLKHYKSFFYVQNHEKYGDPSCFAQFQEAHQQYINNREIFVKKAKQATQKYATNSKGPCKSIDILNAYQDNTRVLDLSIHSHFKNVEVFNDEGCVKISKRKFVELTELNLANNQITDKGISYLCKKQWFKLQKLNLSSNKIGPIGIKNFSTRNWPNIKILNLSNLKIGKQGVIHLVKCDWPYLNQLDLKSCSITDEGVHYLALNNWTSLKRLILDNNNISDFGSVSLMRSNFRSIEEIKMLERNEFKLPLKHLYSQVWPSLSSVVINTGQKQ